MNNILIVSLVGFLLLMFIVIYLIEKILGIKKKRLEDEKAKRIDNWGRGLLFLLYLCVFFPLFIDNSFIMKWLWISFFIVLYIFQAFLEWRYLRETRQYISTIITLLFLIAYTFFINYIDLSFS